MNHRICRLAAALTALCLLPALALSEIIKLPIDNSGGLPYTAKFTLDTMSYDDPSIHVERHRVDNMDTDFNCTYYYATIRIADASQLRTAAAGGFDRFNRVKAHVIARRVNAILAINGDFYGARSSGYVLRQGRLYRDAVGRNSDILLIDEDGDLHAILAKDDPIHADKRQWEGKNIINAFAFGPALIINDEVVLDESSSPTMSAPESRGQRMCLVQTGHLEYMTVCCKDVGCTAQEMVQLVQSLAPHVECAYLMDGGESSQLIFLGQLVNKVEKNAREVTDIIYFASAYRPEE